jgi:hypothetical protein
MATFGQKLVNATVGFLTVLVTLWAGLKIFSPAEKYPSLSTSVVLTSKDDQIICQVGTDEKDNVFVIFSNPKDSSSLRYSDYGHDGLDSVGYSRADSSYGVAFSQLGAQAKQMGLIDFRKALIDADYVAGKNQETACAEEKSKAGRFRQVLQKSIDASWKLEKEINRAPAPRKNTGSGSTFRNVSGKWQPGAQRRMTI